MVFPRNGIEIACTNWLQVSRWYDIMNERENEMSDEFVMYVMVPALILVIGWPVSKLMEKRK